MTLQEIQKAVANDLSSGERRELVRFVNYFDEMPAGEKENQTSRSSDEVGEAWNREISSRIADIDEGRVKTISGEEFLRELRRPLKQSKAPRNGV